MPIDTKAKIELKELLKKVKSTENIEAIKPEIKEKLRGISATDISRAEQELAEEERIDIEELRKICEPHIELMQEELREKRPQPELGHPIQILESEHEIILQKLDELNEIVEKLSDTKSFKDLGGDIEKLQKISQLLLDAESHHNREEEALFPEVERKGLTGPPRVMRRDHEDYLEKKRDLGKLVKNHEKISFREFADKLSKIGRYLVNGMKDHIFKENNILYPAAIEVIEEEKWSEIKEKFDELGYAPFTPRKVRKQRIEEGE